MEPLDLEIQSRVHEAMEKHRLSLSDIGSKAGVSPVILNLYLQSKYRGEVRAVTLKLLDWLSRLDQAKQASRIPSRQSGSPEKVAVAAILSRQRQAEVPMAANADAAVVRQRLLQAQQQQIAAAAALLQNNPAQAAAQGVTVQKLNEMMNTQRQLVGAAGGTGAPVKMPMTPVGAGTIRRAGFARQEAEKVDDGSVDFRCIGGKPIIAITIREKHVNSVYEDHILWNVNGKD